MNLGRVVGMSLCVPIFKGSAPNKSLEPTHQLGIVLTLALILYYVFNYQAYRFTR